MNSKNKWIGFFSAVCMFLSGMSLQPVKAEETEEETPVESAAPQETEEPEETVQPTKEPTEQTQEESDEGEDSIAVYSEEDLEEAAVETRASNGPTIELKNDLVLNKMFQVEAPLTIDLNGHTVRKSDSNWTGSLFVVMSNGSLTVEDSKVEEQVMPDDGAEVYEDDSVLTYYTTTTEVTDSENGLTSDIREKHTVPVTGKIIADDPNPVILVQGGTFTLNGGFILGNKGKNNEDSKGIEVINNADGKGGTANLNGGYIAYCSLYDNNQSDTEKEKAKLGQRGAALQVKGNSTVNLNGTAIVNNSITVDADSYGGNYGAGICVEDSGVLNIIDGGKVASNAIYTTTDSAGHSLGGFWEGGRVGGAGVAVIGNGTVNMDGGYISNNDMESKYYFDGGSGVLIGDSAVFNLNNGFITQNYSASGGGGVKTLRQDIFYTDEDQGGYVEIEQKPVLNVSGGFVSKNTSVAAEGGGVSVDKLGTAIITGGYITNNEVTGTSHWGGGGLFCCDADGTIVISSALITKNEAGGYGGGVAGCSTGRIDFDAYSRNAEEGYEGSAIFGNSAKGEHFSGADSFKRDDVNYAQKAKIFTTAGYQDYFCALSSKISDTMLGGGSESWVGSVDGEKVSSRQGEVLRASYIMGLTAYPSEASKNAARQSAKAYITGNTSYSHGGGILANGYLYFGQPETMEMDSRITLSGTKKLLKSDDTAVTDLSSYTDGFTFTAKDKDGNVVATGKTDKDGNIFFDKKIVIDQKAFESNGFTDSGDFVYTISEEDSFIPGIKKDSTVYTMKVHAEYCTIQEEGGFNVTHTGYAVTKVDLYEGDTLTTPIVSRDFSKEYSTSHSIYFDDMKRTGDQPAIQFVNKQSKKTAIQVKKVWNVPEGTDTPESVTVDLLENGEVDSSKQKVLNSENGWTGEWKNLQTEDENGKGIVYSVQEEISSVDAFKQQSVTATTLENGDTLYTITNVPTTSVYVQKNWNDHDSADRPETITVNLYANDTTYVDSKQISSADDWKCSWENLDKYDVSGKEIRYSIKEDAIPEYNSAIVNNENNFIITNTLTTSVSGAKTWIDGENAGHTRPGSIKVHLGRKDQNGETEDLDTKEVKADKNGNWTYSWNNLDKYDSDGNEIVYIVSEDTVPYYRSETDGYNLINTYETVNISVNKVWQDADNQDGIRPDSITVNLLADGEKVTSAVVTPDDNGDWNYTFEDLPKYNANGETTEYTVSEESVSHYTTEVTGDAADGFIITNSHTPGKTQISVSKKWDDENNADQLRPAQIEVKLVADGTDTGKKMVLNENNQWQGTFTDLDMKNNGKEITYTLEEVTSVKGYTASVSGNMTDGYVITNTHTVKKDVPQTGIHTRVGRDGMVAGAALVIGAIAVVFKKKRS